MGGWAEENVAANTLEAAKNMVAQLRLDIDMGEAFVPAVRTGYIIIPYTARTGENESHLQDRFIGAMSRVRQASILTGDDRPQGAKRLWLNFSTSPGRRKRAMLAGKIKQAVIEAGGAKEQLEVEFATASVWYRGKKVAGGGMAPHSTATMLGGGFMEKGALKGAIR